MKILAYGQLGELIGRESRLPGSPALETIADLRLALARLHPEAADALDSRRSRACIDDAMVAEDFPLSDDLVVEFLPPLSGG